MENLENLQGNTLENDTYGGRSQEEIYVLLGIIMEEDGVNVEDVIKNINKENDKKLRYRQLGKIYQKSRKDRFNAITIEEVNQQVVKKPEINKKERQRVYQQTFQQKRNKLLLQKNIQSKSS
jgi:hypothetical protein